MSSTATPVVSSTDGGRSSSSTSAQRKGIKVSESGAALQMNEVSISIGNNDIMSDITWTIMPKERWALVGRNGAGKSTLLKAITSSGEGTINVREGQISMAKQARLGYLEQKGVSGSTATVRDEVASRMERLQTATAALTAAEDRVTAGDTSDEALNALEDASIEFEAAGGLTAEQKVSSVLRGLGFAESDYDRRCSEFSGGWQMRIALARLLLSEPDLLVLDEPTNHLDRGAKEWLGRYLAAYDGTLLIVSHDESVLSAAANSIAEVRAGQVELYKSRSYSQWLVEREERVRNAQLQYEASQREIDRLQGFVDRFGAKTMGASMAQSRLKTIQKLEEQGPQMPLPTGDGHIPVLKLATPPRGSKELLKLEGVTLSWPADVTATATATNGADSNGGVIISDCNIAIERGMRIAVRGPNGAGKSTLLSALSGKLLPSRGRRIEGDGLELGVFTQDLAQDLDQSARAVDLVTTTVRQHDATLSDERARTVLGALGLSGEKALRLVGHLSGGEKARVALASFVLIPHNLLLLDEPSNHLDVATIDVLTEALKEFEGSVLVISHDRKFLEELQPTHVLTVRGGKAVMEERGLRDADWNDALIAAPTAATSASSAIGATAATVASTPGAKTTSAATTVASGTGGSSSSKQFPSSDAERKKALNAPRRIKKIENSIEKYEAEITVIDANMLANGKNRAKLQELQVEKDKLQSKIDPLYAEYEELLQYV